MLKLAIAFFIYIFLKHIENYRVLLCCQIQERVVNNLFGISIVIEIFEPLKLQKAVCLPCILDPPGGMGLVCAQKIV